MAAAIQHVEMTGVGEGGMDTTGPFETPANVWPERCPTCSFPDIDAVPQPYRLTRKTGRPVEASGAVLGNFLVRERPRAILEAVAPGACTFHPTLEPKGDVPSPWWLAVPVGTVAVSEVIPQVPRCPACGEPKVAHRGVHHRWHGPGETDLDVFKSKGWGSYETVGEEANWYWMNVLKLKSPPKPPPGRWTRVSLNRNLYFSVRLEDLFKRAGVKGLVRVVRQNAAPSDDDRRWVDEQLARLAGLGLLEAVAPAPAPPARPAAPSPFEAYLEAASGKRKGKKAPPDFAKAEEALGRPLPPSYKRFLAEVGPTTFQDVDGEEGFEARVLPPAKLDMQSFRLGAIADFDEEDADSPRVDGLLFASTAHGDAFVFDLAGGAEEPAVLLYNHEGNYFEPYAANFAACIARWAGV
ncbi:SMI1 / KNR4 family protein [Aquisphaera giovannonii]|uniref:SMI1 / KNR4 family protein n=1 Tax=Aquisphaera giovannonii TaxID=406548 RepID=A0A5B9VVZ9_9BACT|nr:SMI1/KNR4 family protein [Aquisphaera giovannonii]QEH32259.1 SMI1 / KNR4 family protein [Aquisphaera giovannonii]